MKRLVFVVPDAGGGGIYRFYKELAQALSREVEVHIVYASPYSFTAPESIEHVQSHFLDAAETTTSDYSYLNSALSAFPEIRRLITVANKGWQKAISLKPDLVEVCDWPLGFLPAVGDNSWPHVVQCHGSSGQIASIDLARGRDPQTLLLQLLEAHGLGAAQTLQTLSSSNARYWEALTRRQVDVLRPAFHASPSKPAVEDIPGFLVLGRLQAWKGPDVVCKALKMIGHAAPPCHWYGGVKQWPLTNLGTDEYLAHAFQSVWGTKFIHHSPVQGSQTSQLLARCRYVVVPSNWDVYNFTAIEAMAAGKPVIISDAAGASELVQSGLNGLIFSAGNAQALADALVEMETMSPAAKGAMADAGRHTVRELLDPNRIAGERLAFYAKALSAPPDARMPTPLLTPLMRGVTTKEGDQLMDFLGTLPARPMFRALFSRSIERLLA